MINEKLLQFIWQFQYYNHSELQTEEAEPIQVIHPGRLNNDQGPDFEDARIKIGNTIWAGAVEIHYKTSDWLKHRHDTDENYKKVILHVVFIHDIPFLQTPILALQSKIAKVLLNRYEMLMQSKYFIPCESIIAETNALYLLAWKERLAVERLMRKSQWIINELDKNYRHWEEVFWWLLARSFGGVVNGDIFETIAKSIPLSVLGKHKNQQQQIEAILLGQAGLLNDEFEDSYAILLQKEFKFLKNKYNLKAVHSTPRFLRMRPGSFPTVRLAQLAAIIHESVHLFSKILEETHIENIRKWFVVYANDYWLYHYRLNETSVYKEKKVGDVMINHIVINVITPMLFAYGLVNQQQLLKDRAILWQEATISEKNSIIRGFEKIGIHSHSSKESQALIELKTIYCNHKECLRCSIGSALLKPL